jgi:SAM-dependent methyltransferase
MNPEQEAWPNAPDPDTETVSCPGCGATEVEVLLPECSDHWLFVPGSFPVVRCVGCSLVRTDPRPGPESLPAFYPPEYKPLGPRGPDNPIGRSAVARAARKLAAIPYRLRWGSDPMSGITPGVAIDIGGGDGSRLRSLRSLGWEIWLMEPRREAAKETGAMLGLPSDRIVIAYAEDADLPAESFDLITMDHVVEHLSEPSVALSSIARWLKPGGRLFIACPNFASIERKWFGRFWTGLDVPRHLFHFTPETLEALARDAGLELVEVRPQFGVLFNHSVRWLFDMNRPVGPVKKILWFPIKVLSFITELFLIALQPFGYMPMMEVTLAKPPPGRAGEGSLHA